MRFLGIDTMYIRFRKGFSLDYSMNFMPLISDPGFVNLKCSIESVSTALWNLKIISCSNCFSCNSDTSRSVKSMIFVLIV